MTTAQVFMYDPGFINGVAVNAIEYSYSVNVNGPGQFSMVLDKRRMPRFNLDHIMRKWVTIRPKGFSTPFVGQVRDDSMTIGVRFIELAGATMEQMLSERVVAPQLITGRSAGAMVSKLLTIVDNDDPIMIDHYDIEENPYHVEWSGNEQSLDAAITDVATASAHEWDVTTTDGLSLTFRFKKRVGRDRSAEVFLTEHVHIASGSLTRSREGVATEIVATGDGNRTSGEQATRPQRIRVTDGPARRAIGRIQVPKVYYGALSPSALRTAAKADLERMGHMQQSATWELRNHHGVYATLGIGDIVTVILNEAEEILPMRIMTLTMANDQIMSITTRYEPECMILIDNTTVKGWVLA